ncbi:MAG: WG repeat-containing protein [Clostridia bacterium]|nr:WG repeat-containing protein [Clostridia bacterium]
MNIFDEELVKPKKENKSKKTTKILLVLIILVTIAIIVVMCLMAALKKNPLVVTLDEKNNAELKSILLIEDNDVKIPIKEIAPLLGYDSFNGDYINKSEETDKCYVESKNEIVNFVANSNKIEKIDPQTMESSYYEIDEPVKSISGKLYISPKGMTKAFNVYYEYDEKKNKIIIQTMEYIIGLYNKKAIELGFKEISNDFNDAKASIDDIVITIDTKGKYGIYDMDNKEELLEAKYDKISYIPTSNEFLITSNGKMGIKDAKGKDVIKTKYQDIELISQSSKLYIIKQDDRYGIIDKNDNAVLPAVFDKIGIDLKNFDKNNLKNKYILLDYFIPVMRDNKWGLFDLTGKQLTKLSYDGFGCIISSGKNSKSTIVISDYDIIVAKKDKKYCLIDREGKELGNGVDFEAVFLEIEAGKTTYYVTRNEQTVDFEKIAEKLLKKITSNTNNE